MGKTKGHKHTEGTFAIASAFACTHIPTERTDSIYFHAAKSALDVEKYFLDLLRTDQSLSAGIAAIKTLLMVLKQTKCMYIVGMHSKHG